MKQYFVWGLLHITLLMSSCKQTSPLGPQNQEEQEYTTVANLSLEAEMQVSDDQDEAPKTLKYQERSREALPEGKPLYALCLISSLDGVDKHWCEITWQKTKGRNHFYAKQINQQNLAGQALKLNPKRNYKITGFLTYNRANIDKASKSITFRPNNPQSVLQPVGAGKAALEMDIPLFFDWVSLKLTNPKGSEALDASALTTDSKRSEGDKIKIKPLGTLTRIELQNDNDYTVRISSMKLHSTVVSSSGVKFDLNQRSLPRDNVSNLGQVFLNNDDSQTYRFAQAVTLNSRQKFAGSYLLWVAPKSVSANTRQLSHITVNAKRIENGRELSTPNMQDLYVWGSVSAAPSVGSRRRLAARIHRPKTVLEYFSDGYLQSNKRSFGSNASYKILFQDFRRLNVPGYRIMGVEENRLWGVGSPEIKFLDDNKELTVPAYTINNLGNLSGTYTDSYKNSSTAIYALRFDNTDRRHYSAWKYTDTGAIYSVYLGPSYKGTLADVAQESFWNSHRADMVVRTYGPATSKAFDPKKNQDAGVEARAGTLLSWFKGAMAPGENHDRYLRFIYPTMLNNTNYSKEGVHAIAVVPMHDKWGIPDIADRSRKAPVVLFQTNDGF